MVAPDTGVRETILEMTSKRLGCAVVVENDVVQGIITDGDLRRMMKSNDSVDHLTAKDIMSDSPKTIYENEYATKALSMMRASSITQLIVADDQKHYLGVVHLHDILREGII